MIRIEEYERKGLVHETQILNNILSLWSPFITLEYMEFSGNSRKNPSHPAEITYDFKLLAKDCDKYREMGYYVSSFRKIAKYYPVFKNLVDVPSKVELLLNEGLRGSPAEYEVGRYYMGQGGLVVYLEERITAGTIIPNTNDYFVVYVLNLWSENKGKMMLPKRGESRMLDWFPEDTELKGEFEPWFNIYLAPLKKIQADYRLDVTEWINTTKVSFMNWKENPFEVRK